MQRDFSKGVKKVENLIDRLLGRFKFKKFKMERKGQHVRIYSEVSSWVLLYDSRIEEIESKKIRAQTNRNVRVGDIIEHG